MARRMPSLRHFGAAMPTEIPAARDWTAHLVGLAPAILVIVALWNDAGLGPVAVRALLWCAAVLTLLAVAARTLTPKPHRVGLLWLIPTALLMAHVALSAWNPAFTYDAVARGLSPVATPSARWLPATVDAGSTLASFRLVLVYIATLFIAQQTASTRTGVLTTTATLLGLSTVVALIVCMQAIDRPTAEGIGAASFVNENHYAAFANLALAVALHWGRHLSRRAKRLHRASHPGGLCYIAAALLLVSQTVRPSRAGILIAYSLLLGFILAEISVTRLLRGRLPKGSRMRTLLGLALPVILGLLFLSFVGLDRFGEHANAIGIIRDPHGLHSRWEATRTTLQIFAERPWFGIGAGTFHCAFPYYQPHSLNGFFLYAHNDWAQYLAELGIQGTLLILATIALLFGVDTRSLRTSRDISDTSLPPLSGFIAGLLAVGLHALIDFPLHLPAVTLLATVWAVFALCLRSTPTTVSIDEKSSTEHTS